MNLGFRVYGLAALWLGLIGLIWGDFAFVWQPVPANVPNRVQLAYLVAITEVSAGLSLLWRRTALSGAIVLAILYALNVLLLHVPHIIAHPLTLAPGWSGAAEQTSIVAGGLIAFVTITGSDDEIARLLLRIGWVMFGLCCLCFGAVHFVYEHDTASYVPAYLPLGQDFWARFTGWAHIAGGLGILSGIRARLAAQLLTVMFMTFGLLVHLPNLLHSHPGDANWHLYWVMNAMSLLLTGSAWCVADSLKGRSVWGFQLQGGQ